MEQGKLNSLSEAFHALGHPTKLKLLRYVMVFGKDPEHPIVPTMAAVELDLPVARVGYHLKRLSEVGLLHRHVTGRYAFYSVNEVFLRQLKEFLQ